MPAALARLATAATVAATLLMATPLAAQAASSVLMASQPFATSTGAAPAATPQVTFDGAGNATAVYVDPDGRTIDVASRLLGQTDFGPRSVAATANGEIAGALQVSENAVGVTTIAWVEKDPSTSLTSARVTTRLAGQGDFGLPVRVTPPGETPDDVFLSVDAQGRATVVRSSYADGTEGLDAGHLVRASETPAPGAPFGTIQTLSTTNASDLDASANASGAIVAAWTEYGSQTDTGGYEIPAELARVARRAGPGAAFGARETVLATQGNDGSIGGVNTAVAPDGVATADVQTLDYSGGGPYPSSYTYALSAAPAYPFETPMFVISTRDAPVDTIAALRTDHDGHVVHAWVHAGTDSPGIYIGDAGGAGQTIGIDPSIQVSGVQLAPDAAGGMHLLWAESTRAKPAATTLRDAYRPPFVPSPYGPIFPSSSTRFALVDGFSPPVTHLPALASADPFGNGTITWDGASAIIDRAPPSAGAIHGPSEARVDSPVTYSLDASDTYGPVSIRWTFGDGSPASDGPSVTHTFTKPVYNPPVPIRPNSAVTATVTDAAGNQTVRTMSVAAYRQSITPKPIPPAAAEISIKLSPSTFRAAAKARVGLDRGAVAKKTGGGDLTVSTSVDGDASFVLSRPVRGHLLGKRCAAGAPSRKHRKACMRWTELTGSQVFTLSAGNTHLRVTGRWRHSALRPGRYRLSAYLSAGGTSKPSTVDLRLAR